MPERLLGSQETISTEEYDVALHELQSVINTSPVIEYGVYDCYDMPNGSYSLINAKPVVAGPDYTVSEQGKRIGYRKVEFIDPNTGATIKLLEKHDLAREVEQIDAHIWLSESKGDEIPYLKLDYFYRKNHTVYRNVTYNDFEEDINKWPVSQLITVIAEQKLRQTS